MSFSPPASPHPVDDPRGYQEHLLGLLGDDDPATVQASSTAAWRALVAEAGAAVAQPPAPGEWSVLGCLAHAVDAEIVSSGRYRWILAHEQPPLVGYDQDLWVERLHGAGDEDAEDLLAVLDVLRTANLALWGRRSQQDRARVGIHSERGPESYDLTFRLIAGHDRFHLAQARRALDAVTG